MRLLIVLLSLVISSSAFGAEKLTLEDGRVVVCFEEDKAKELLNVVEADLPELKNENELLKKKIEAQQTVNDLLKEEVKIYKEETKIWKDNYKAVLERVKTKEDEIRFREDIDFYTNLGIFLVGTVTGVGIMYGSSLLLANTVR